MNATESKRTSVGGMTRRDLAGLALAVVPGGAALAAGNSSRVSGVTIGATSYSFRDRTLDGLIQAMVDVGLTSCVLWQGHVEPRLARDPEAREKLRRWRTSVSMQEFKGVREKFRKAGIHLHAYYYNMRDDFSDEEIARGFEMAKALGVKYLAASSNLSTVKRIDFYALRANIYVGLHNHAAVTPNEFARPEDFEQAMRGTTHVRINLDIGHFVGAGRDPVKFIAGHHRHITHLDIKDRNQQKDNLPFGQGTTPIREVLQLLKTNRYKIPAMIEYEYKGTDSVTEVRKCFEYCRRMLA
jgi:sugar phosphate isomerase/epimerase